MDEAITRAEHEEFSRRMEDWNRRQDKRLELLEENVREIGTLTASVEKLALSVQSMVKEQERQGERLDKLEGKPGDNWNIVVKGLLTAVATAIGGGLVATVAAVLMK